MGRPSLKKQVCDCFNKMFVPGRKKHLDKKANKGRPRQDIIYSYRTLKLYTSNAIRFVTWCKERHGCRYLAECRDHVQEYLMERRDRLAASTVHNDASALAKLYGCSKKDFGVKLPKRERRNFVKNRGDAWVGHYSKALHKEIHILSEGAGLRRGEMKRLTPEHVTVRGDGRVWLEGVEGKGGKFRDILVRQEYGDRILAMASEAIDAGRSSMLSEKIPNRAPAHADRGLAYARGLYAEFARPIDQVPRAERYYCRKDMRGQIYDKKALRIVTRSLGHERLSVVMNYLR